MISFNLDHLLKALSLNTVTLGVVLQCMNLGGEGDTIQSIAFFTKNN